MLQTFVKFILIGTVASATTLHHATHRQRQLQLQATPPPTVDSATQAYLYGFPLLQEVITEFWFLTQQAPNQTLNAFHHNRAFPAADQAQFIVRENLDTLYSDSFLDLSQGPIELSIGETSDDQFYLLEIMDAWTNVIADPGARTTGHTKQIHKLVGPDQDDDNGVSSSGSKFTSIIHSPTNMVWIVGRTLVHDGDFDQVHTVQDSYVLSHPGNSDHGDFSMQNTKDQIVDFLLAGLTEDQYSALGGNQAAHSMVDGFADLLLTSQSTESQNALLQKMSGMDYFNALSVMMCQKGVALSDDTPALAKYASDVGFVPCHSFQPASATARQQIEQAPTNAYTLLAAAASDENSVTHNEWVIPMEETGQYGTDYYHRAAIAYDALAANLAEDAVYPTTFNDGDAETLHGGKSYTLTFPPQQIPPVDGFWSVTMYTVDGYLIENPDAAIQRYNLNSANTQLAPFRYEPDGSLRLVFQPTPPQEESMRNNWIPSKDGIDYCLSLRLYAPHASVLDGTWVPPPVVLQGSN